METLLDASVSNDDNNNNDSESKKKLMGIVNINNNFSFSSGKQKMKRKEEEKIIVFADGIPKFDVGRYTVNLTLFPEKSLIEKEKGKERKMGKMEK